MKTIGSILFVIVLVALSACSITDGDNAFNGNNDVPVPPNPIGGNNSSGSNTSSSSSSSSSSTGAVVNGSHNAGLNCMESGCHLVGSGGGGPEFYVSGTIYRSNGTPQPDAEVRLFQTNTNTLVKTLQTDASGNFYSADVISELHIPGGPLVSGVDVEIQGPSTPIQVMSGVVSDGHCNLCHQSSDRGPLRAN